MTASSGGRPQLFLFTCVSVDESAETGEMAVGGRNPMWNQEDFCAERGGKKAIPRCQPGTHHRARCRTQGITLGRQRKHYWNQEAVGIVWKFAVWTVWRICDGKSRHKQAAPWLRGPVAAWPWPAGPLPLLLGPGVAGLAAGPAWKVYCSAFYTGSCLKIYLSS